MDVLTDILSSLRLTGGVVIDAEMSGPYCLLSRFTDEDCRRFQVSGDQLIAYHYVRSGQLFASVEGSSPVEARSGDIILLPRNDPHLIYSRAGLPPVDSHDLIQLGGDGPARIVIDEEGEATELFCGFLGVSSENHPLLDSLPPILKLDGGDEATGEWLESSMRLLNEGRHSPEVVAKLSELFFAEAVRRYMDNLPPGEGGWLAGLRDPAVAKALSIIHSRYADDLDVESLARDSGVSRSVLGERFVELIGEPPMRYCAHWRMRMAANMLRDGKQNTANIAYTVGFNSEAAFNRAFKREFGMPPAAWRKRFEAERQAKLEPAAKPLPPQQIHYTKAQDGTQLAWSAMGEGPPLVKTANWLNHLQHDAESPIWRGWLRAFAANFRIIRYDERGNGLSDWDTPELSLDAFVDDLACVVDAAGLERFDLFGISQGAPVSIAYALRHPERVRKIVLCGGYAAGWKARGDPAEIERREAMVTLTELGWGSDNPAYRQMFTSLYLPGANAEQMAWYNELQRRSASPAGAARLMRVLAALDVRDLLGQVRHPTLIFHARNDQAIPFSVGEDLAAGIKGSRFVPLESDNHIMVDSEPAFRVFMEETRRFLLEE